MDSVTVSSKGQIAIPKKVRDHLNLAAGTRLTLDVRGRDIVLTKDPAWKKLNGAAGKGLMHAFAAQKRQERAREDSRA